MRATVLSIILISILDTSPDLFHLSAKLRNREQNLRRFSYASYISVPIALLDKGFKTVPQSSFLSQVHATLSPHIVKKARAFKEKIA